METQLHLTPLVLFRAGAVDRVGTITSRYGRRALLVTDRGLVEAGIAGRVQERLAAAGVTVHLFDRVPPNPDVASVEAALRAGEGHDIDVIVAVGGGSVADCAKTVALVAAGGGEVHDYEGVDRAMTDGLPVVAVNTTAGSGAEVSRFAVITDRTRGVKMILGDARLVPKVAVEDPLTMVGLPPALTAASGLDALTHAVEAAVSTAATPISDLFALEAVRLAGANLERAVHIGGDLAGREGMLRASLLAAFAFNSALVGAVHAMAHPLGAVYDLPHGVCNGILLPIVAEANLAVAGDRYDRVAAALAVPPNRCVDELRRLGQAVGLPPGLADLGVEAHRIPELAAKAVADLCMSTNPRRFTQQGVEALYRKAM